MGIDDRIQARNLLAQFEPDRRGTAEAVRATSNGWMSVRLPVPAQAEQPTESGVGISANTTSAPEGATQFNTQRTADANITTLALTPTVAAANATAAAWLRGADSRDTRLPRVLLDKPSTVEQGAARLERTPVRWNNSSFNHVSVGIPSTCSSSGLAIDARRPHDVIGEPAGGQPYFPVKRER